MDAEKWLAGGLTALAVVVAVLVILATQGQSAFPAILAMTVLIAGGTVTLGFLGAHHRRRQRRQAVLAELASLGLIVQSKNDTSIHALAPEQTHLGHRRARISAQARGTLDGRSVSIFNHRYIIMAGQTPMPVSHRVVSIDAPHGWPTLEIKPRSLGRFSRLFRGGRIELEDDAFNTRYSVETENEGFAIALLRPELQDWLAQLSAKGSWHIERDRLFYLEPGTLRPGDPSRMMERLCRFLEETPLELRHGAPAPRFEIGHDEERVSHGFGSRLQGTTNGEATDSRG